MKSLVEVTSGIQHLSVQLSRNEPRVLSILFCSAGEARCTELAIAGLKRNRSLDRTKLHSDATDLANNSENAKMAVWRGRERRSDLRLRDGLYLAVPINGAMRKKRCQAEINVCACEDKGSSRLGELRAKATRMQIILATKCESVQCARHCCAESDY